MLIRLPLSVNLFYLFNWLILNVFAVQKSNKRLVGPSGLEPLTPTMSRWCSNQLSYGPMQRSRILATSFSAGNTFLVIKMT
jgi:hypothetical protein